MPTICSVISMKFRLFTFNLRTSESESDSLRILINLIGADDNDTDDNGCDIDADFNDVNETEEDDDDDDNDCCDGGGADGCDDCCGALFKEFLD